MKKSLYRGAVLAGLLLAGGELTARFGLGLGDPPLSQTHPSIEYLFAPNQDVQRFGNRVAINAYGMRSNPFPMAKAPGERRVLVFGDSVVNGGTLTDQEDLATDRLQRQLTGPEGSVTVGNVSAGSWGPGNWLAYAREFGFLNADVVVLVVSSHDVADLPTYQPLDPQTHPQRRPLSALWEGMQRYLPRYLPGTTKGSETLPAAPAGSTDQWRRAAATGAADLKSFLELARTQVSTVLLFQHPTRNELAHSHQPGRALIAEVAAQAGVPVFALDAALKEAVDRGQNPYRDNIHINEAGQQILADQMARVLIASGGRPPSRP